MQEEDYFFAQLVHYTLPWSPRYQSFHCYLLQNERLSEWSSTRVSHQVSEWLPIAFLKSFNIVLSAAANSNCTSRLLSSLLRSSFNPATIEVGTSCSDPIMDETTLISMSNTLVLSSVFWNIYIARYRRMERTAQQQLTLYAGSALRQCMAPYKPACHHGWSMEIMLSL